MTWRRLADVISAIALGLFLLAIIDMLGCASRKPAKLPLRSGVEIEFRGVRDGKCHVAAIEQDVKTGRYTAICTP